MPRYNVKYNGKWACFSSIPDGFITEFVDEDSYEAWRKNQYGEYNLKPVEQSNRMAMEEAVFNIRMNRTHEEALNCMLECGLPESECDKILCDMENKHYRLIPKETMTHEEYTAKQSFIDKHCPRIKNCCDGKGLYGEKDIGLCQYRNGECTHPKHPNNKNQR